MISLFLRSDFDKKDSSGIVVMYELDREFSLLNSKNKFNFNLKEGEKIKRFTVKCFVLSLAFS